MTSKAQREYKKVIQTGHLVHLRKQKFNPDRDFVKNSVDDYLKNGGKITKIEIIAEMGDNHDKDADFFLMDGL